MAHPSLVHVCDLDGHIFFPHWFQRFLFNCCFYCSWHVVSDMYPHVWVTRSSSIWRHLPQVLSFYWRSRCPRRVSARTDRVFLHNLCRGILQAVCCSVLQCVAVCCSLLQAHEGDAFSPSQSSHIYHMCGFKCIFYVFPTYWQSWISINTRTRSIHILYMYTHTRSHAHA